MPRVTQLVGAGSAALVRGVRVRDLRLGLAAGRGKAFAGRRVPCSPRELFP